MAVRGNCIVGQSGGPTAVINASLSGVVSAALAAEQIGKVYGAVHGIEGVMKKQFVDFSELAKQADFLETLKVTPASFLGTCRFKLPKIEDKKEVFEAIFKVFEEYDIKFFFYIGGNDSMDTVAKISRYAKMINYDINVIGVPKTVDNDLLCTDHTPGFGSAAKYIAATVREVGLDSAVYDKQTVSVIEIMGRNAGWLTAAAALARDEHLAAPHLIYLPETTFSDDKIIADIKALFDKGVKNVVAVVSEGAKYADGRYVCEDVGTGATDSFGHKQLSGTAAVLGNKLSSTLGIRVRGIELSLCQRCAGHFTSLTDVTEAEMVGKAGVAEALNGGTGKMMIYVRVSENPYKIAIESRDIDTIANGEKMIPREWINEAGNDVTQDFINYARPLIMGETPIVYKDGVPNYVKLKK